MPWWVSLITRKQVLADGFEDGVRYDWKNNGKKLLPAEWHQKLELVEKQVCGREGELLIDACMLVEGREGGNLIDICIYACGKSGGNP